jgi:phenylacetate-CoA ligase
VGPIAAERVGSPGFLEINESQFVCEVIDPLTLQLVPRGEVGELVVTNLGRTGSPLIRYRTGDLVRITRNSLGVAGFEGGVLGRVDDMIHIRGNNVYPSAIEAVLRAFPAVAEFRVVVNRSNPLSDLLIEVEPGPNAEDDLVHSVGQAIRDQLLFRAKIVLVPKNSLPRHEMKARRIVIQ